MKFWLGFLLGAHCAGNRVSRILFLLWILFLTFCLHEMSKPLGYRPRVPYVQNRALTSGK
jgi:hypothetical protein